MGSLSRRATPSESAALLWRAATTAGSKFGRQGQRRHHHGDGSAGAGDPGARQRTGRDRLQPRAQTPQPCSPPAFQRGTGAGFRSCLDLDRDGHRRDRRRRDVRHARPADPVPRRSGAGLCGGARARLQQLGGRLLQDRPAAPQIRGADRDARHSRRRRGGAPRPSPSWAPSRSSARRTRSTVSTCTTRPASRYGTSSSGSTCRSAITRPATPR